MKFSCITVGSYTKEDAVVLLVSTRKPRCVLLHSYLRLVKLKSSTSWVYSWWGLWKLNIIQDECTVNNFLGILSVKGTICVTTVSTAWANISIMPVPALMRYFARQYPAIRNNYSLARSSSSERPRAMGWVRRAAQGSFCRCQAPKIKRRHFLDANIFLICANLDFPIVG